MMMYKDVEVLAKLQSLLNFVEEKIDSEFPLLYALKLFSEVEQ